MTAMERIAGLALERGPSAERIDILHFDLAGFRFRSAAPGIVREFACDQRTDEKRE